MGRCKKIIGSVLLALGFMLSPFSWWNDVIVNLPLALAFAWGISSIVPAPWRQAVFETSILVGYWLTNVLGLILMRRGATKLLSNQEKTQWHRELAKDLAVGLGYTLVIIVLLKLGILRSIEDYFSAPHK